MESTLDKWGATPQSTPKKSVILNDQHAHYLHEKSFGRQLDKLYDEQIERFLEEERAEKKAHKDYTNKNYVRVGGN